MIPMLEVSKAAPWQPRERFCHPQDLFAFSWGVEMDYMTITEASKKWEISNRRIQTLCAQGRIPGAERLGYCWLLPKEAVKPADARIKSGKYIGYSEKRKRKFVTESPVVTEDNASKNPGYYKMEVSE